MPRSLVWWLLLGSGCFRAPGEAATGPVALAPAAGELEGWVVQRRDLPLTCPDGTGARLVLAFPEEAAAPLPVAVVFHPGAFDHVLDPDPDDPLSGAHLQEPSRLSGDWAVRSVFATLGMSDDGVPAEEDTGALALALAEQGVAMVLPTNCWGDLWHGEDGTTDTDADGFSREGLTAALLAWEAVGSGDLPFPVDPARRFQVGLGEGGRAVGELCHAGHVPDAAVVDSVAADLGAWDDPVLHGPVLEGLARVFPAGDLDTGALATAPLPERTAYVYSSLDPTLPAGTHEAAVAAVEALEEGWVLDTGESRHVPTRGDLELARDVARFLLDAPAPERVDARGPGR